VPTVLASLLHIVGLAKETAFQYVMGFFGVVLCIALGMISNYIGAVRRPAACTGSVTSLSPSLFLTTPLTLCVPRAVRVHAPFRRAA
jgi:hypothetical protein